MDASVFGQPAQLIGLTLLQATTTNLNGAGITVGHIEADTSARPQPSYFEVNPANAGKSPATFTYMSGAGGATGFTNAVGVESSHADSVACIFYGGSSGIATNVAHVYNYDANYYIYQIVANNLTANNESIANQSFTLGWQMAGSQALLDTLYDNYEETHNTLFVSAVGAGPITNSPCPPGTAYNGISVGAYQNNTFYNNIGPTIDNGRCKPDITAIAGATSFSTPQVSGAAAVLMQAALRGDGGTDTNSAFNNRTIKALLLNGAVKPSGWTNSSSSPLDARYGSGVLNIFNSYRLLAAGKQSSMDSSLVPAGGAHPPTAEMGTEPNLNGWDFDTNTSSTDVPCDAVRHYYFNLTNNLPWTQFTLTATLVWNRHYGQSSVNTLGLYLYNCANSNLVACSTSLVDNVQHLYLPKLDKGRYDLQVWKAGGTNIVSADEPYALSWQFFANQMNINLAPGGATLSWPMYPAGFYVLGTTNPAAPVWTNVDLSSLAYINGTNSVFVSHTNGIEFFRLGSPNL